MLDKFKTLLSDNKDVKEEEFEASQLAVASLMVTTALHDGEFDEIEINFLRLLMNLLITRMIFTNLLQKLIAY